MNISTRLQKTGKKRVLLVPLACLLLTLIAAPGALAQEAKWESVTIATASGDNLSDIVFVDENVGYISGYINGGGVFKTTDGGEGWTQLKGDGMTIYKIAFFDAENGIGIGRLESCTCGYVATTTDGGNSWSVKELPEINYMSDIQKIDENTAYMTGTTQGYTGSIGYVTTDKGKSFQAGDLLSDYISPKQATESGTLYGLTGGPAVYKSTDVGTTWTTIPMGSLGTNGRAKDVTFISETTGFVAAGANGPLPSVYRTTDGGSSWEKVFDDNDFYPAEMDAVFFMSSATGFATGGSGMIARTNDGGNTWERERLPSGVDTRITLYAMDRVDDMLYVVGSGGVVLRKDVKVEQQEPPRVAANMPELDFGQTLLGDPNTLTVEISNSGGLPLEISDIRLADGAANKGFMITSMPSTPLTFNPGLYVEVEVEFTPATKGDVETMLLITTNDPDNQVFEIPVSGLGTDQLTSVERTMEEERAVLRVQPNPLVKDGVVVLTVPHSAANSKVELYNGVGELVAILHEGAIGAGEHQFHLNAVTLDPGAYLCIVHVKGVQQAYSFLVR